MCCFSHSPASSWYLILVTLPCEKVARFSCTDLAAVTSALWFLPVGVFLQLGCVRSMSFISSQEWAATVTLNVTQKTKSRRMLPLPQRGLTTASASRPRAKVQVPEWAPPPQRARGPAKAEVAARALEVFVLKLKQALIRFGTPLLGSLLKPDRNGGELFLALRSQFRWVSQGSVGKPVALVLNRSSLCARWW